MKVGLAAGVREYYKKLSHHETIIKWLWELAFFRMPVEIDEIILIIKENLSLQQLNNSGYLQTVNHIFPPREHIKLPITQAPQRLLRTKSSMGSACADSLHKVLRLVIRACINYCSSHHAKVEEACKNRVWTSHHNFPVQPFHLFLPCIFSRDMAKLGELDGGPSMSTSLEGVTHALPIHQLGRLVQNSSFLLSAPANWKVLDPESFSRYQLIWSRNKRSAFYRPHVAILTS